MSPVEMMSRVQPGTAYGKSNSSGPTLNMDFPVLPKDEQCNVTFHALREWEGYVIDIRYEEFAVRSVDLTAGRAHEGKEAVIPMAGISEYDASRMVVGGIFRCMVGYER